jgi:hypothetical protein
MPDFKTIADFRKDNGEAKHQLPLRQPLIAANNNQLEWPFIPFPDGSYSA